MMSSSSDWARDSVHIEIDEGFIVGGDLVRVSVPDEDPLVELVDLLEKRHFEVETGFGLRGADRSTELGDHHLPSFLDHVKAIVDNNDTEQDKTN